MSVVVNTIANCQTMQDMIGPMKCLKMIITNYSDLSPDNILAMYQNSFGQDGFVLLINLQDKICKTSLGKALPIVFSANEVNKAMNAVLSSYLEDHNQKIPTNNTALEALFNNIFAAAEKVILGS
ncbi:MAG: hypothetical protein LBE80_04370 [Deltaproteobacteria bacterium]|jgi:hypothetical protein|nr:hypothetical protein [Deltaproteobacteria bacterium]